MKTINGSSILGTGDLTVTGSGTTWGSITGTLSSQTDLQNELDGKLDLDGGNANTDIDIDVYSMNAKSFHAKGTAGAGHVGLKHQSANITASASESTIGANVNGDPVWKNDGNAIQNIMLENTAITGATKTKITYDAKGLITSGADATTADIAESTNRLYVSDGDKGDITVSSSGTVWNIDAATVGVTELSATGTPSSTTFLRGDNTWDTPANPEGWSVIVKSTNQDVTNSVTLVDDTDLKFSVVAGGHYMVEMQLTISANNTTGDYKFAVNVSSGTMKGSGIWHYISSTGAGVNAVVQANAAANTTVNGGTTVSDIDFLTFYQLKFSFTASANATFSLQFANVVSNPAYTSRTWKGSILKYKRID